MIIGVTVAAMGVGLTLTASAADTTPPSVPGSVSTGYYGGVGTVVSWGKVSASDLASYVVYRSTSKTIDATTSPIASPTALTYTDATAPSGQTLYYAVAAKDKTGNISKLSSVQTVKTIDSSAPGTPSGLKATASSAGIALDWSDVSSPDLAGYKVFRATSSSGTYTALGTFASSQYNDTAAPAGSTSYYKVASIDKTGNTSSTTSAASATRPAGTPPPPSAPAAPSALKTSVSNTNVVTLSWTAPSGTVTGYAVGRSASAGGPFVRIGAPTGTATSYADATAPAGATYYYQVIATNAVGNSPAAISGAVTIAKDTTAPATPSSPKAVVVPGDGGMTISWSANKEADLAGYIVFKRNGAGDYVVWPNSATPVNTTVPTTTATSVTDPSVTEGKTNYFRIRAVDTSGNVSSYVSVTANNPNVAPAAPSGVRAVVGVTAGISLTWATPKDTDVAGYNIYRSIDAGKTYPLLATVTAATVGTPPGFADTSAPTGIKAAYKITAQDLVGNISAASSVVSATSMTAPVPLPVKTTVITVGAGRQYPSIGSALATIAATNLENYELDIAPGTYREKIEISSPNVTLRGMGGRAQDVVITYDTASGSIDPANGQPYGTAGSYTVFVSAKNVKLTNLSVVNAFDEAGHPEITSQQAVALRVEGDRFIADNVRLIGNQDTLLADTPKTTTRIRQYYVNSFIEGDVDFLFGAADAVFDHDVLHSLDRGKSDNGAITAASTNIGSKYGFLITNSKVVSEAAAGTVHLGRPWHPGADPNAVASVVYSNTILPAAIAVTQPWEDMAVSDSTGTKVNFTWQSARFDEYANLGAGSVVNTNRPQLSLKDGTINYTPARYLAGSDGWNPVPAFPVTAPTTPTGLTITADNKVAHLTWDDSVSADVLGWDIYRSNSADGPYSRVANEVSVNSFTDIGLTNGSTYYYEITAANRWHTESVVTASVSVVVQAAPLVPDITVDPSAVANGTTVFNTVGAALAAAPAGTASNPTVISIAKGTYAEYLTLSNPYTVLLGATGDPKDVVITGNRAAGTPIPGAPANPDGTPATYGTSGSATMLITGNSEQLQALTVQNSYVEGTYTNGQAVAVRTTGDRLVFENVRLLGNQDTFYANSPALTAPARIYVHGSYIEGDVDFLFGRATAVFDHTTLYALDHGTSPNGAVTAASTDKSQQFGFLITDSRIIGSAPDGSENLGRPWQPGITQADGTSVANTNAVAQVVVRNTYLGSVVSTTQTWTNMVNSGITTDWHTARFAEYRNTGPGASVTADRPQLIDTQAATDTSSTYLSGSDGWDPVVIDVSDPAPAAVTGLSASGDDGTVTLGWNDNLASNVTGYRVYRATVSPVDISPANLVATVSKPVFVDTTISNGTAYSYAVVTVDAAGQTSAPAGPLTITPNPKPLVADLTVAADGSGDYTSVQAALTAAKAGTALKPTVIFVKPGTYREVVSITKPYLVIKGATGNAADVVITYDNANGTTTGPTTCPAVTTATCGTSGSATVSITSANVTVRDLTIRNGFVAADHPEIGNYNTQAVALKATADKQIYNNVRLLAAQDTLLADSSGNISADGTGYARQYYVNSFIEGNVDFVFGRAAAVFDRDTFHATVHNGGTIFAPSTASKAAGYLVYNSRIVSDNDPGGFYLGRPWRAFADGAYADISRGQTVLVNTWMNAGFDLTHPWTDFAPNVWTDGRFAESGTTGPGAVVNANRPQLSDATGATPTRWLAGTDGWNPVLASAPDIAPSTPVGLVAAAGDTTVTLSWNESTESDVVGYHVYRNGTAIGGLVTNARYDDTGLVDGSAVDYMVAAVDATGYESARSAPVTVTPVQRIDAVVSADGSTSYATVQAAVDADPGTAPWVIQVNPGSYAGPTSVTKSNVTLQGATGSPGDVVLTNSTTTATLSVTGSSVTVRNLSVRNTAGVGNSPAVSTAGDKILFNNTNLVGTDRTVWADVPTAGATAHVMIENSTIVGTSNIVLGRASLVVHSSTIVPSLTSGTVFVPSTTANGGHGFLIIGSTVAPAATVSDVRLGAGYAQGSTSSVNAPQAIIRDSVLNAGIKSQPWQDFNGFKWTDGRFAEYENAGPGAVVSDLRPQLTPAASVDYTVSTWLGTGGWYPAVTDPAAPADVTAPAAPSQLTALAGDKTVALTWIAPADTDLAGYRLYRSTTTPVVATYPNLLSSNVSGSAYLVSGLTDGTAYNFALIAVDTAGNTSLAATISATPADSAPPAAPTGVKAGVGDGRVTLTWTGNTEPDLAGYRVYRDGSATPLNAVLATSATFTDNGLTNGTSYSYVVTAVDSAGNESAASSVVAAVPAPGDSTPPAVPVVIGAGPDATRVAASVTPGTTPATWAPAVSISWTADADADLAGYTVYRAIGNGIPARLNSVLFTGTRYTDSTAAPGTAYSYTVTAADLSGNESAASPAKTTSAPLRVDVVVAADGSGDATGVTQGINLIANNADYTSQNLRTVLVRPGTYSEAAIGGNRYGVNLIGATTDPTTVVITSSTAAPALTLQGKQWTVSNLTLSNTSYITAGTPKLYSTATALTVSAGDKDVFSNVRILGDGQALNLSTAGYATVGRMYFSNAYIEGGNYLVIGRATAVFDRSTFHVLNEPGSSIFDSSLDSTVKYGFLMTNSTIITDASLAVNGGQATPSIYLGQPYPDHTTVIGQITVRTTSIDSGVRTDTPWKDWNSANLWTAQHFFEYQNTGTGSAIVNPATRPQLSDGDAAMYTAQAYLTGTDGWNPTS